MSEPTDFDKLLASLEPAATRGESEWSNVAMLSAAVSLKRIADVLDSSRLYDGDDRVLHVIAQAR